MLDDLRKYGVALSAGTSGSDLVRLSIRKSGSDSFATGSDWSPVAGDVKVSKDGGAQANITTLPSYSNGSWEFTLSAAELTAKMVRVIVANASIINDDFTLKTYGNASAFYPLDFTDAVRMAMSSLPATGMLPTVGTGANQIAVDGAGNVSLSTGAVTDVQNGLATSASQTTILNRLGGFAGSATSSIFAALRKLGGI